MAIGPIRIIPPKKPMLECKIAVHNHIGKSEEISKGKFNISEYLRANRVVWKP